MHLTFFGSSLVSSYWNGAATYYRGLLRALASNGHDIVFCEPDAYNRQENRDLSEDPDYARVVVYSSEDERDELIDRAFSESDWVIKCSGVGIWDEELEMAVAERSGHGVRTGFWDVDAPATLASVAADESNPFRNCIPRFDRIFTYGGGPPVIDGYLAFGGRRCTPIYNGLDPDEHRPLDDVGKEYDVLFMGNRLPDREERVDEFFFRAASLYPDGKFALGGEGWGDKHLPDNVTWLGHVPTHDHNMVNSSARIVLNIHRHSMVQNGWSPATRMFEAAGAAACQITDEWLGIEDFFQPGTEVLVARDGADVARFVSETDEATARSIGLAAHRRALADHTYERRARQMDRFLRDQHAEPLKRVPGRPASSDPAARG